MTRGRENFDVLISNRVLSHGQQIGLRTISVAVFVVCTESKSADLIHQVLDALITDTGTSDDAATGLLPSKFRSQVNSELPYARLIWKSFGFLNFQGS